MTPRSAVDRFVGSLLAPVGALLADPTVSELLINGPDVIYVERAGKLERAPVRFADGEALEAALLAVSQYLGRPLGPERPILEGRLPDGSRIEAVLAPIAAGGPSVAIRRHQKVELTLTRLLELGTITERAVEFLEHALLHRENVLVAGGTGSGKTALLNCLASLVPPSERVVTIEDARELGLPLPHVVSLEARPADERGRGAVGIPELFRATLRLRPDRIVIGELRGSEAFELIQAMTSGHGGCLSTLHASTPHEALLRLEAMALERQLAIPLAALRRQIASAVQIVVQVERMRSGARRIVDIARVRGLDEAGNYMIDSLAGSLARLASCRAE